MLKNIIKKTKILISISCLLIIFCSLIFSKIIATSIFESIVICIKILIPSIFIFLIISEFFYKTNALNKALKPFNFLCEKLFKIDRKLGPTMFFSLICGYPAGANLIANLVKNKIISKQTATRMLYFCVNAGPSFLIGGISIPLSNSIYFGVILFISQIISFFVVGFLSSIGTKLEKIEKLSNKTDGFSTTLVSCVKNSTKNMAMICGFTIFFSTIINCVFKLNVLNINSHKYLKPLVAGFLEITTGITKCLNLTDLNFFIIAALISSFGGLCVHFQILAITSKEKIHFKNFYIYRLIYCLTSVLTSTALFIKFLKPISAFAQIPLKNNITYHTPIISISLIILSISLLFCEKKIIIMKKNK